ncbi:hypothetical protein JW613_09330 [Streptomyces smyrnaeus]|uniref:Uncharacterized protein n=1 Tax=Streptomyces smyrnaeus TaxID=1387713 RepID=A0ABS3XSY3_9ACTN|nr:hypothetical protein [Streptomyces smyrnaeus]MBO8198506.1 hypothetical protein [Streptomyces smyrnaeus]
MPVFTQKFEGVRMVSVLRKVRHTTGVVGAALLLSVATATSADADTVRPFQGGHCNGWIFPGCLHTIGDPGGEVRFGKDSYLVTADVELLYRSDATYGYIEHWSREYGGGRSDIKRTTYIYPGRDDPSNGRFQRTTDTLAGRGKYSPTHGKSVVVRFCVAGNAVSGFCGKEIEIFEKPR